MTIDADEKVRDYSERLVKEKLHTQQSEIVSDTLRQLFIKYKKEISAEEVMRIMRKASKKAGKSLAKRWKYLGKRQDEIYRYVSFHKALWRP